MSSGEGSELKPEDLGLEGYTADQLSFIWITAPDGVERRLPTIKTPEGYYKVLDPDARRDVESAGEVSGGTSGGLEGFEAETLPGGADSYEGTAPTASPADKLYLPLGNSSESKGVFTDVTRENALHSVLRCEFFFEVWRVLGGSSKISGLTDEQEAKVRNIASPEAYYYHAVRWLVGLGRGYLGGMYDWLDIANPITWVEVAYLFWEELGFPKRLDWKKLGEKYTTSVVINESPDGGKRLVLDVNKYKSTPYFSDYLRHIRKGKRHLPYPLVGCYEELRESGMASYLRPDDVLREVSRKEAKAFLGTLSSLTGE